MKRIYLLILIVILFCIACNKKEILENNQKTEIWRPLLSSTRNNASIEIQWLNPEIYEMILRPFTFIDPDVFEIYMSDEDPQQLEKIATLRNDKKYKFEMTNLVNGRNYFFAVKAFKKGKLPLMSDTIMVMPSVPEKIEQFIENIDFPMESGSISIDNQIIAYVNRNFNWDHGKYGQMSLFALNLISHENKIIDTASYFPDCSHSGIKIVYCSDKHEINKGAGFPQQLLIYHYQTNKIQRLTQGEFFNTNPDFSHDDNWIVYSSDEGHHGFFNIWKVSADGTQRIKITENLNLISLSIGNVALGRPTWSIDDNYIYFNRISENKITNGIYRISLQNSKISPVINSRWFDVCPSVSPDNNQVGFISNRSGTNQIWIYNMVTNKYKQITGCKGDYINSDWGKIEWVNKNRLLYSGFSTENSNETIFTIEIN